MKKTIHCLLIVLIISSSHSFAQPNNRAAVKVAVFVPIYINDAFNGTTYKLGKLSLPKNILPGLEFYNGAMMAIDSLQREGVSAEINIYDTKDYAEFIRVITGSALSNTGVIIAALTNTTELSQLAKAALQKNIPLISATYPNTGNINANPFFVLLNSSLQAHVEGIYKYLQRNHSLDNILMVKRNGATENYLQNVFTELNKSSRSVPLKMKWVSLTDTFGNYYLTRNLDTTKRNVVVVSSPNERFGVKVVKAINDVENVFNTIVIGMPTWDGINEFNRAGIENVEIVYTTPFNYPRYNYLGSAISTSYRSKYGSRPSDMVYKGYETVFHFTKLLSTHRENFVNRLSDSSFTLFNQFNIQPVKLKRDNKNPDYYENKKLYFVKKREGSIESVTTL
jgi:hypothetical protein